ncbi:MAG TPA: carbohydrate kinase family protein [Pseudonocardiaceae bacterium]|jgi:adenosine kinase|nr:carbohydrate kinase family protein [Pseudonocardiaceae bacterium]
MRIVVTGSIAVDHLTTFPGAFTDHLIAEQLDHLSLSFLADGLDIHYGGVAANIAAGLGRLGHRPVLVAAVGQDFAAYRAWLEQEGVDTESVLVRSAEYTARFWCTTDQKQNQIATFFPGAMSAARHIELAAVRDRLGDVALVVIGANDPVAMVEHTAECRRLGLPFAADPSQQLATLEPDAVRGLVEGARYLFTNEYERALLLRRTGWTEDRVWSAVGTWITTLSAGGARVESASGAAVTVPAVPPVRIVDPTGAGDGFRAGFLAARSWDLPFVDAARLGCMVATVVLETAGTAEYQLDGAELLARIADAYGKAAAAQVAPRLASAGLARSTGLPQKLVLEP